MERQRVIYSRDVKFDDSDFGILQGNKPDGNVNKLVDIELSNDDDVINDDDELSNDDETNDDVSVQRPSRERQPPDRFGEWVTVASDGITEPATVDEALNGTDANLWRDAMQHQMDSLHKHNVFNLVELPNGRKAIGSKWVFRVKHNADGSVERCKARTRCGL